MRSEWQWRYEMRIANAFPINGRDMTGSSLYKITLHLARTKEFPEGSAQRGYSFVAPLRKDGTIDADAWRDHPEVCIVRRFWSGEAVRHGRLLHRPGGANGATWMFDYDMDTRADDEAGYRFADHRFTKGEYVSIRNSDDDVHTFRIERVERS